MTEFRHMLWRDDAYELLSSVNTSQVGSGRVHVKLKRFRSLNQSQHLLCFVVSVSLSLILILPGEMVQRNPKKLIYFIRLFFQV
ncbi:hypothetical protein FRX31_028096 [Thalictrum thalictroides]|uniref:Uncharacterized protein n=1 Tax=Thalictrum thalictroides TaxID=46969 RepID=A0A7J6VB54_THATH|nr:hypothetical protein FRX31_028096 [Thalictrum thalictroides]